MFPDSDYRDRKNPPLQMERGMLVFRRLGSDLEPNRYLPCYNVVRVSRADAWRSEEQIMTIEGAHLPH